MNTHYTYPKPTHVFIAASLILFLFASTTLGQHTWDAEDPFAAIDGKPIFLGELNLVLAERFGADKVNKIDVRMQQATATLLVRRALAMRTLEKQGGETLEAMLDRGVQQFETELHRRGTNLSQYAKKLLTTDESVRKDLRWKIAWKQYLKSRLTKDNLNLFFNRQKQRYGGARWEVSQIFVPATDADSVTDAKIQINAIADRVKASDSPEDSFALLAREYSQSGSASDGGMIGWVERDGELPTSVMKAVRSTSVNSMSDAIISPLGVHLVWVHAMEEKEIEFDDLTDIAKLRRDATDALFDHLVNSQQDAKVVWLIKSLSPP